MVTVNYINQLNGVVDLWCLSTDELPTDTVLCNDVQYEIKNGSTAFLMDKSCYKMFDKENEKWRELDITSIGI